jgi:hypothetical protein
MDTKWDYKVQISVKLVSTPGDPPSNQDLQAKVGAL